MKLGYGNLIRQARVRKGWSQKQLAERLKTSESTVSHFENEQNAPTVPDAVNALVLALNLSPEELLMGMGVRMAPGQSHRLPAALVRKLLTLTPEQLDSLTMILPEPPSSGDRL